MGPMEKAVHQMFADWSCESVKRQSWIFAHRRNGLRQNLAIELSSPRRYGSEIPADTKAAIDAIDARLAALESAQRA